MGFDKVGSVKCRLSGLVPNVSVITATIRALEKGGIKVIPLIADEMVKGGGGPRCTTMPLWRDDA